MKLPRESEAVLVGQLGSFESCVNSYLVIIRHSHSTRVQYCQFWWVYIHYFNSKLPPTGSWIYLIKAKCKEKIPFWKGGDR